MIYGLYLSAQGAQAQSTRLDVLANNLANASTGAFKRDLALFQAHHPYDVQQGVVHDLPGDLNQSTGGVSAAAIATDFSDGPIHETGGTYDLALTGPGFFKVSDGGQEFLTRNGQFTVNEQGDLVTQDLGFHIQGVDDAPITIPEEAREVEITNDGRVIQIAEDGLRAEIGQLALVQPDSLEELEKIGNSFYRTGEELAPAGPELQVRQGYLEASGTRPILETLDLIDASRGFETNLNMLKFQDEALGRLLQSVPRR